MEIFAEDTTAHLVCHPTNIAFSGSALYAANLGRWHITRIETGVDAETVAREIDTLAGELEKRLVPRLEDEEI